MRRGGWALTVAVVGVAAAGCTPKGLSGRCRGELNRQLSLPPAPADQALGAFGRACPELLTHACGQSLASIPPEGFAASEMQKARESTAAMSEACLLARCEFGPLESETEMVPHYLNGCGLSGSVLLTVPEHKQLAQLSERFVADYGQLYGVDAALSMAGDHIAIWALAESLYAGSAIASTEDRQLVRSFVRHVVLKETLPLLQEPAEP